MPCRIVCLIVLSFFARLVDAEQAKPNVLFIAVDDLRPQLNCYGATQMVTPNIDRLASTATLFERAYCMVPTCGASRAALMTGLRPSKDRFVTYLTRAEVDAPGIKTMNTHFHENGYTTISLGKVFHHTDDNAQGWSEPARRAEGKSYHLPENIKLVEKRRKEPGSKGRGPAFESAEAPESDYPDGNLVELATAKMQELANSSEPFFLAVGLLKPHLPFVCPKKYWDLYDHAGIQVPENYYAPEGAPEQAIHNSGELRAYAGIPRTGLVGDENARNLIHGYYACVSFADAQIGKILAELDRLGLTENTIVVLWGDHGWNLGEHTLWCKHSCFETSMQIPLIIRGPGIPQGARISQIAETIDLYPTLCELAQLEQPEHLQGQSLVGLMTGSPSNWKNYAVGRFGPGDTIRTDQFRFTEYAKGNDRMLYDHQIDPAENRNLSELPGNSSQVNKLGKILNQIKGKDSGK